MRITDPVWRDVLKHLCYGQVQEDHIKMLRSLIITDKNCPPTDFQMEPWKSVALVTPRHAVRRLWNEKALHKYSHSTGNEIISCKAVDTIKGEPLTLREQYALAARGTTNGGGRRRNQDLPESIDVAVGMKVMVTQNVETDLDITNGAQGTVTSIVLHPDEPSISARETGHVELQNLPLYILVKLDQTRVTQLAGLDECVIPVEKVSA